MTGPPGLQGAKGDTGAQRPSGQKRERGDGTSGVMFYKNWKECAWKNLNDDRDNGLIKVINICRKQKLKVGFSLFPHIRLHSYTTSSHYTASSNPQAC